MDRESELKPTLEPAWQVEVDRATPGEWSAMVDLFDDANLYQTWSYGAVRWGTKNLSHLVLKRNGEIVAMAQLRIVRPTRFNFGMAYLRWGPLCHRRGKDLDADAVLSMSRVLQEEYVCKRSLLLQIIPNAFAGSPRATLFQASFSQFTQEPQTAANVYRTFVLDLSPPIEQLRKSLDAKWRNKLSGAEKNGPVDGPWVRGLGVRLSRAEPAVRETGRSVRALRPVLCQEASIPKGLLFCAMR